MLNLVFKKNDFFEVSFLQDKDANVKQVDIKENVIINERKEITISKTSNGKIKRRK